MRNIFVGFLFLALLSCAAGGPLHPSNGADPRRPSNGADPRRPSTEAPDPAAIQRGMQLASKFGLSLYHWNVQYVSGSRETEDALVKQSFDPVLDLYLAHPTWHTTFEMQGYMVEVLAERFPA